jgi:hypothetical protein
MLQTATYHPEVGSSWLTRSERINDARSNAESERSERKKKRVGEREKERERSKEVDVV